MSIATQDWEKRFLAAWAEENNALNDANARRFNILHAVGPDGHREIIGLAAEWKCSFEEAVDRYGAELIGRFYGKREAV